MDEARKPAGMASSGTPRWMRWAPVVLGLAMGGTLAFTLVVGYLGLRGAGEMLVQGQAGAMMRAAERTFRPLDRPPTARDLAGFLADNREDGVRWIGLVDRDGTMLAEAGESTLGPFVPPGWRSGPREAKRVAGRVRVAMPPPPGPPGGPPPLPPSGLPEPTAGWLPPPIGAAGPAWLVLEFEPLLAQELEAQGLRTLVVGLVAAALFVLFALVFARAQRQREALERRLEQERRLAVLGEMSAVLAHEIRNPLTALKGHAQLLAETLPAEEGAARAKVDRVVREALRLETLTSDLLDFVRSGEIRREDAAPAELLRAAAEEVDGDRFELRVAAAPAHWPLDPTRMRQALVNVLRNAVQATPEGVRAAAEVVERDGRLVFEIRDHGPGIPAGEAERIFEPFHTTRVRGTGLGLAVARRVVLLHGGTIVARNGPDGGAVFVLELPRGAGRAE